MARRSSLLALGVLIQLLETSRVDAQRPLGGAVRDSSGAVLPGVSVTATSPALSEPRNAVTDREGRYSFGDLPDGTYAITFTLPGFVEITRSDIILPAAGESRFRRRHACGPARADDDAPPGSAARRTSRPAGAGSANVHHARDPR